MGLIEIGIVLAWSSIISVDCGLCYVWIVDVVGYNGRWLCEWLLGMFEMGSSSQLMIKWSKLTTISKI